jgi:hypothetical protein
MLLYMFLIGLCNYRRRPRHPPHMDTKVSWAEAAHPVPGGGARRRALRVAPPQVQEQDARRAQHRVPDLRRACAAPLLPAWRCSSPSRPSSSHGSGPRCCSSSAWQLNGARQLYREKDRGGSSTARGRIAAASLLPHAARGVGAARLRGGFANVNAVGLLETIARRRTCKILCM